MILPGMGVVSEIIPLLLPQARSSATSFIAFSSMAIAVLGFLVWGHHMFVSGQSRLRGLIFSLLSFLVAHPVGDQGVQLDGDAATKARSRFDAPMLYALGFIGLFTIGGLTGLFLASLAVDVHVHDTYFVVAHFHYIMVGGDGHGATSAALHFWWPKITGRLYPEGWARLAAFADLRRLQPDVFPAVHPGLSRHAAALSTYPPEFQVLNVLSTAGASLLAFGYLLPLVYLIWSLRYGARAPANPWSATGLEWQTAFAAADGQFCTRFRS